MTRAAEDRETLNGLAGGGGYDEPLDSHGDELCGWSSDGSA